MLRKTTSPKGEPTDLISALCNAPAFQLLLILALCQPLIASRQPAFETGRKPPTGGKRETLPTVCIALKNQQQLMSGITTVLGSLQTMNSQLEWRSQCCLRMDRDCCNETEVYLQQSTVLAETVTEKCYALFWVLNIFICFVIHVEHSLPIQTKYS